MAKVQHPELSITDFLDIVHLSGAPKGTKIRQVKQRPDYHPAFDFYRPLREAIVEAHQFDRDQKEFATIAGAVTDPKKKRIYPEIIEGYLGWWGRKSLEWFDPPRDNFVSSGVKIIINPEVGLAWGAQKHVTKLYFKEEKIDAYRVSLILDLMEYTLQEFVDDDVTFSVLDIRSSKLHVRKGEHLSNIPHVKAELAYIAELWPQI